jgi:ABC-type uncharacterized transport system permease subunit
MEAIRSFLPTNPDLLWLLVSTLLFGGEVVWVALGIRSGHPDRVPGNVALMAGGFVAQWIFLYLRGKQAGSCPITTPSEILVFVAWSAVVLYFLVGRPFRLSLLGMFTAPLAVILQLAALPNLAIAPHRSLSGDFWLEMHAAVSLLAYGSFALAFIAGVLFLTQDHLVRAGHLDGLSSSLPPVTNLTHSIVRLVGAGLLLLSLGILCAFGMRKPPTVFHLAFSVVIWLVYAGLWAWRRWGLMPNARLAWCAIASFLLPVMTMGLMEH